MFTLISAIVAVVLEDNGIMDIPVAVLERMNENGELTKKLKALLTVSLDNSDV